MKTTVMNLILAAAALIAAAACTNDDNVAVDNNAPVAARITAGMADAAVATPAARAGQPGTRAVGDRWNRDSIGVVVVKSPGSDMATRYRNARYATTSTGTTAEFTPVDEDNTIYFGDSDEPVSFAAYAPYQPSATPGELPGTDGVIVIDATKQATVEEQEAIDFIFATGATASKDAPTVSFTKVDDTHDASFKHAMSRLVLKIETPAEYGFSPNDVKNISRISLGGLCTSGDFGIITNPNPNQSFGFVTGTLRSTWTDDWDITNYVHSVGPNKAGVMQRVHTLLLPDQQAIDIDAKELPAVPLSITFGGQVYENDKDIIGEKVNDYATTTGYFCSGKSYEYTIRLKKNSLEVTGATITDWTDGGSASGDATPQP